MKRGKHKIPPDLEGEEGFNEKRAAWGGAALDAFIEVTRTDREDSLADLLCDMAHWCDRHGFDMRRNFERAARYYLEETCGEGGQFL